MQYVLGKTKTRKKLCGWLYCNNHVVALAWNQRAVFLKYACTNFLSIFPLITQTSKYCLFNKCLYAYSQLDSKCLLSPVF